MSPKPVLRPEPALYRLVHIPTKKFYVGSTKNMSRRYYEHMSALARGVHPCVGLQELFNTDDAVTLVVADPCTYEEAVAFETAILVQHKGNPDCLNTLLTTKAFKPETAEKISIAMTGRTLSDDHKRRIGAAAEGNTYWVGRKHNDESKKKISEANMGNQYAKGHVKSPEGVAKIRATHLGRKHTDEARLKTSLNSAKAKTVIVDGINYRSFTIAGEALGISGDTVRRRVQSPDFPSYALG